MPRVLIIDDEPGIRDCLTIAFDSHDFESVAVGNLAQARKHLANTDLIVLDLSLGDGDGLDLLRELQGSLPCLVLTSRDTEVDRVVGLELGADDYVAKPFSPREIVARARAILRRSQAAPIPTAVICVGELVLDQGTRRATWRGQNLSLSKIEFDLLGHLAKNPDRVFSRSALLDEIWGDRSMVTDRSVDAHIKAIRKKLHSCGADPCIIESVRGVGYRLIQTEATHS